MSRTKKEEKVEKMEGKCELCEKKGTVYCYSDKAKLCWCCDARVHSANSLASNHIRDLLCCICNSRTQWKAFGSKLIPSSSFCLSCVANGRTILHHHEVVDEGGYSADDSEAGSTDTSALKPINSNNETGCSTSSEKSLPSAAALPSGGEDSSSVSSFTALKEHPTNQ